MEAMEAILARRSIRHYTAEPVTEEALQELLKAAMSAPSAHNRQPRHFVIITDRRILDEIRQSHPWASMLTDAPVAILVCGDLQLDQGSGFWVQDCAAATENMLIAAQAKGLGAVWVGIYPVEEKSASVIRKLIGIPEHIVPLSLVPIGHPVERKPPANRYNPARIHRNHW